MAMDAAALMVELGLVPKRTIPRGPVHYEKNGLRGGKAYHAARNTTAMALMAYTLTER